MSLEVEITVSIGVYGCTIKLLPDKEQETYSVEVKQKETFTNLKLLSVGQYVCIWDEPTQTLISPRHKTTPTEPYYWLEIKEKISAHIMANR